MRPSRRLRTALAAAALAATAARAQFAAPVNVSQSPSGSYLPSLTVVSGGPDDGTLRLFWHDFSTSPNALWCSSTVTGAFDAGAACGVGAPPQWSPRAASDSSGRTHLVWRERTGAGDEIFHATFDGTSWSVPTNLSGTPTSSRNPVLAVDPADRPHVLWEEDPGTGTELWESHFDGAAWSAPAPSGLLLEGGGTTDSLRLACDPAGTLHAAWHDGATTLTEIFHAERPAGGSWSARVNVSQTPAEYSSEPAVSVGADGTLHLAWVEQDAATGATDDIHASSRPPGGAWTAPRPLTRLGGSAWMPSLAVGSDDRVRLAFSAGPMSDREVLFLEEGGDPIGVSSSPGVDSSRPSLVLDGTASPWVAWQEGSAPTPEIFVAGAPSSSPPVTIFVRREGGDVVLSWTGGTPPFVVTRATAPDAPQPWAELGRPPSAEWTDAGAARDGRALFYLVE